MDKLFEEHILKYKLDKPITVLLEVNSKDEELIVTLLNYSHQLLEYSENRDVYESHDRLFKFLQSTSISIKMSAIRLMCCVQERFLHHNPMKYNIPKPHQEQLLRIAKSFPPQIPIATPSPVRIEVTNTNISSNVSPKKLKKHKKNANKKDTTTSMSLWDCFRPDYNVPTAWKQLNFEYYKTANTIIESKKTSKFSNATPPTVKSEFVEGLHFFKINEETIKKLSYQQIYDKAMMVIPKNRWFDFVFAVAIAKAYCSRSYESIRIREMLVTMKCLTLACGNSALTNAIFDDEPYLLNHVNDLINLDNKIPRDIRLVAMRFLVNTSAKKNGASDLLRSLGGNVSHGLLFHILRTILKQIKEGRYDNDQRYLNYFYNILANMLENKPLAICLKSAGLMSILFEFLTLRNEFRMTRSGPLFLIEVFCQTLPEAGEEFITQGGFEVLISLMKFEVNFAIENPMYDGGAPNKPEFSHKITTRQVKILTSLMKLMSTLVDIYSGDRIRNLYDSPIQKSLINVLLHPDLFGHEMINGVIRVMTSIINSEPTSFSIFKESGLIQTFFDEFDNLLLPNADLILDLTDAVNAVALNTEGQTKVIETQTIKKLLSVLYRPEMCKVLCVNADVSHFGLAIDELSRHHPELKQIIDEEILLLIDNIPASVCFNDVEFYRSPKGSLYYSRDEDNVHYEDEQSELKRWDTSKSAEVIQCCLMFLSHLFENNKSWKQLFSKIDMKNLFKFISIENAPFDVALSQSIYHFRNIIRAIDTTTSCYSLQPLLDAIKEKLDAVRSFIEFSDNDKSYFDQFDNFTSTSAIPTMILSNLCSLNSLLYIFSELYGKLRQAQKAPYIFEKLSAHSGLELLFDLTTAYKRLAIEEAILFHRTPTAVAGNTFTPVNSATLKQIYITAETPKTHKFDGTSAKFKNSSVIYFHCSRIKFWLRSIFSSLVVSPEKRSDARALGMTPTHFVTICQNLANFFMSMISEVEFEDLEIQTGYYLIIINQIYELMCHKSNTTINIQGVITICMWQNPKFPLLREKIVDYFTLIPSLDPEAIKKWSEQSYTSVELASSSITLLDILLKLHYDLASWSNITQAQIIANRCYCDIQKTNNSVEYDYEISLIMEFSVGILNFLVYQSLFSAENLNILENLGSMIPKKLTKSLIELGRVAFKRLPFGRLLYEGKLFAISGSTTCPSDDKIDHLISLGISREHSIEILLLLNGSLDVDRDQLLDLEENFTEEDIDFEEFAVKFEESPYVDQKPTQIKICSENDEISIETVDDLNFHRGANEASFIETCIRLAELHPDLTSNILTMCDSVFSTDSIDNVLNGVFKTMKTFDFREEDEEKEKALCGILDLTGHLILKMRNKTQDFSQINEVLNFISVFICDELIDRKWFVSAFNVFVSVFSVSKAPCPTNCHVKYPNRLMANMGSIPDMYVIDVSLEKKILSIVLQFTRFSNEELVSSVCKLLLLLTIDTRSEEVIANSEVMKGLLKFISENKTEMKTNSLVINVIRRSMETETVLRNYISREVDRVLSTKRRISLPKKKDLEGIVSELSPLSLRNSDLLVEYLTKDSILVHGTERIKSTEIARMTEDQKKIAATSIDAPDIEDDVEMIDDSTLVKNSTQFCSIMHILLSELKELTKHDLTIDDRTLEDKEKAEEEEVASTRDSDVKNLLDRNLKLQYSVFLMQTISELLFSYNEAKTSFLTFSKKSLNTDVTPKPRSTALNMLIHRFIAINPFEEDISPEAKIKSLLSTLASACILGLNSTVPIEGIDFTDAKNCDPDVTFARKFTVDILIKVVKEAEVSKKSSLIRYGKIMDIVNLVNNIFTRDFGKRINLSTDHVIMKHDGFQFGKELLEKKFPTLITDVLATLDVNFPYTGEFTESILKCLTKFGKIKVDYQNLFKEGSPIEGDEEVYEDEDEMDEDTPNLLRNSTLGMYDIGDIEDEEGNSDFVDEFLDDEDIEIVIDDNDMGSEDDSDVERNAISAVDSDMDGSDIDDDDDEDNDEEEGEDDEGDDSNRFMEFGHGEDDGELIYDSHSSEGSDIDESENLSDDDSAFGEISDDFSSSDEMLEDHYVVDLVSDSDAEEDVSMTEPGTEGTNANGEHQEEDDEDDDQSDNDSIILDQWLENHEMEQARRRRRNRRRSRIGRGDDEDDDEDDNDSPFDPIFGQSSLGSHGSMTIPAAREGYPSTDLAIIDAAQSIFGRSYNVGNEEFSDLRRLLDPLFSRRGNQSNVISIKSTGQRWQEFAKLFNSLGYAMRVVPVIINKIYERSRLIYDEETNIKNAIKEKRKKEKEEKLVKKREDAANRAREREIEQEATRNATVDLEPVMIDIGGMSVDISGTGIDPEFLLALPEEMREEVYAQHLQDASGAGGSNEDDEDDFFDRSGLVNRSVREEGEEDDDDEDDSDGSDGSDDEDDEDGNFSNTPFGMGLVRNLRYDFPREGPFAMERSNNDQEEVEVEEKKTKSNRLYFTSMVDKSSIAALLKIIFLPQMYTKRELYFQAISYLCLNKQNRGDLISILLYILQEGLKDQISLQNVYQQVCIRAFSLINPKFKKNEEVLPAWCNFPVNSTTLTVATQAIDVLQYLMENETTMRIHMLTEQDGLSFMKKSKKSGVLKDKSYKYPINILLNLLDNKLIRNDANLMDILSRTIQISTRPLVAIKAKLDEGDLKFKDLIQLPIVQDKTLKQIITILVADECPNKVFQQAIVSMQNLSVLDNAKLVYPKDLSKKATQLSTKISKELRELIKDLNDGDDNTPSLSQFSSGSSDQAKLLRVLTALDYLYQGQEAEEDIEELKSLYKNSALGPLWGALSDCLKLLTEDDSKSYIAFILSPLIEALMVVCKHSKVERMDPMEVLKYDEIKLDFTREPIESLFFSFTEEHKKILNHMIRSNPKLMSGPFSVLVRNPKVLEFDNKRVYFEEKLHKDDGDEMRSNKMEVKVRRDQVFLDTYRTLYFKPVEEVKKSRLEINFKGEEGVDAGGVTREWYQVLARQMFDPNYALFTPVSSDKSTFHPNRTSWVNPEHLSFFKFVGMIIGKAVNDGFMLDCHFSRAVFKSILGKSVSLKDMESMDLDYYKSLVWMLENDISDIIVETFSVETDDYGEHKVINLKPGGDEIAVTEENKQEYVKLIVEYRLITSVKNQMDKFLEGFFSIIPKDLIKIFDEQELELLVSGMPDIDVDDWRNNTNYENYSGSSKQVQWFWRAVKSFDADERAKLLQFATGTSKVPLDGFKELPGMNGVSKFSIHRVYNSSDRLPTAHTCFNQVDLPEYESYSKLRNALLLAIREGYEGFGFA